MIGPLLDRLQRGRRTALAVSFGGRAVLAVVMAFGYDSWVLYPAALGAMVLSKSFVVLKAAVTPRVLPETITLVTTNSRLTTFGLASGAVFGGVAAGIAAAVGLAGGAVLHGGARRGRCAAVPADPGVGRGHRGRGAGDPARADDEAAPDPAPAAAASATPMGRAAHRGAVGQRRDPRADRVPHALRRVRRQGADRDRTDPAAAAHRRRRRGRGAGIVRSATRSGPVSGSTTPTRWSCPPSASPRPPRRVAALLPGIGTAAVTALVAATCSALAKVALDAVVQRDLPERSRASAFGRSETVLQLAWVFGGALGVLLPHDSFRLGFGIVAGVMVLVGIQAALVGRGRTLLPPRSAATRRPQLTASPAFRHASPAFRESASSTRIVRCCGT